MSVTQERKDKVAALIANEAAPWAEADREFLEGMPDAQFQKICCAEAVKKEDPPKPTVNEQKPEDKPEAKPKTVDEFLANVDMPDEVREELTDAVAKRKTRKAELVKALLANTANPFTEAELGAKPLRELEGLVKLAHVNVDYSGQSGAGRKPEPKPGERREDGTGVPPMPTMRWNKDGSPDFSHLRQ